MRLHRLLLAAAICSTSLMAGTHLRLGGIAVGGGYAHYSGPFGFYPIGYGWPGYWTWGYLPLYYPGYYSGYARGPNMGEVKLEGASKTAEVFLNGAYAGPARKLKSMWLDPGAYDLEVRSGQTSLARRIYVLSGKTLRISAALEPKP
jgi:hypothetical protein